MIKRRFGLMPYNRYGGERRKLQTKKSNAQKFVAQTASFPAKTTTNTGIPSISSTPVLPNTTGIHIEAW